MVFQERYKAVLYPIRLVLDAVITHADGIRVRRVFHRCLSVWRRPSSPT